MNFELCTDSVEGAEIAGKFGFTSIELCSALSVGGLTPNYGLIKQCAEKTEAEVHVMIRHREGGFQASDDDINLMSLDIKAAKKAGAHGVVFGILQADHQVAAGNKELVLLARRLGLKTTFHRAFDFVPDFRLAIKKIENYGFDRLLTSGLQAKAEKGITVIAELQQLYGHKIKIIAGSGINAGNAMKFSGSGIQYLHFTARKPESESVEMGMGRAMVTDIDKIQQILNLPFHHIN